MMIGNRTVYLVDSDKSARRGLKHYLTAVGYKVVAFTSYGEFLKIETIDPHACLIMDAHTSELSTINAQIEFIEKTADIPVIFIAAGDGKESLKNALAIKAASFFHKPIDGPALWDAIRWALETHESHASHSR